MANETSLSVIASRYSIKRRSLRTWVEKRINKQSFHSSAGNPFSLDEQAIAEIKLEVERRRLCNQSMIEAELHQLVRLKVRETNDRRNQLREEITEETIREIIKKLKLKSRKPQVISEARQIACSDPRMSYAQYIMLASCSRTVSPFNIFNFDATQLVCKNNLSKKVFIIEKCTDNKPISVTGTERLGFAIKWVHMGSASGDIAPLVLIIDDDSMTEDDFDVFDVVGLTHTSWIGARGYICFTKSRAGNKQFFSWFMHEVVIKTAKLSKEVYEQSSDGGSQSFITCDGEWLALDSALDENSLKVLDENKITLGKISASCSGIHQASDVSPLFRAVKKKLENISTESIRDLSGALPRNIDEALNKHQAKYRTVVCGERKSLIADGILSLVSAMKSVVKSDLIVKGFNETGQYPLDFDKVMQRCYRDINSSDLATMKAAEEGDIAFFKEHGYLPEAQMDRGNIVKVDMGDKPRDERPLSNNRAAIISHVETWKRYVLQQNSNLDVGDVLHKCSTKKEVGELRKAMKKVSANEKVLQKKAAEQERKANMTPEQIQEEKTRKKAAAELRKLEKEDSLAKAKDLIQSKLSK